MFWCGLPIKISDAVHADHLKAEAGGIFVGPIAFASFHRFLRDVKSEDVITEAIIESTRSKRSVPVRTC